MRLLSALFLLLLGASQAFAQSGLRLPQQDEPGLDPSFARGWLSPGYDRYGSALHNWREQVGFAPGQRGDALKPLDVPGLLQSAVEAARREGDSLGGVVTCAVRGCPPGWGEPVFDRLEADLAKAVLSLPASKGFEIGSGFAGTDLRGSEHNDAFYLDAGRVRTRTNRSGGVQGGITNGETIYFRVAFKPTATIVREQPTVSVTREETTIKGRGRHDPCVLPRAVPMVEAMTALVLADHALAQQALGDAR